MNPIELLVVFYSIVYYHIVYKIISGLENNVIKYQKYLISYPMFLLYIIINYYIYLITMNNIGILFIGTFYLINVMIITKIGNNYNYLLLGVMISLFQSEFWEIPYYLYLTYLSLPTKNIIISILQLTTILSKLAVVFYIVEIMNKLKFDVISFINKSLGFLILYSLIVIASFVLGLIPSLNWLFRFTCSTFFILFIYLQKVEIDNRSK